MPLVLDQNTNDTAELGDVIAYMKDNRINPSDCESFCEAAKVLASLKNNRRFLADRAAAELKDLCQEQDRVSNYTAQVMMLLPPGKENDDFFIRANFWPSERDAIYRSSGPEAFFYHHPHDHNFNFLTVGYYGPGYLSDYYEYDYGSVAGYKGEVTDLRFVERTALHEGKVMLYRAFYDVHDQLPPESMSISINICENSMRGQTLDQYAFDPEHNQVTGIINRNASVGIMPVAAEICGEEGRGLLAEIACRHPNDRIRFVAFRSLAITAPTASDAVAILEAAADDRSPMVAGLARHRLKSIHLATSRQKMLA